MSKPSSTAWKTTTSTIFKLSILTSALAALGLTGCASTQSSSTVARTQPSGMLDANSLDSLEDLLSATDMRAVEGDRLLILKHGDVWKRMTVGFKMDLNHWDPRIEAQRGWFASRQPYLERLSARASRYLYHTVKEAERRGMPTELALLPIIESSYDPAATSSAAAAGMWQFIPSTGRIYGLKQSGAYDGRRDVVESTRAAYEFLGSLYNQFGSWELALAAYNAGPGRIQQAINRNQAAGLPTDYWSLKLPQETMNYVPRFLAVAQIVKSPNQYGVSLPPIANRPHFREISVPAGAQLNQIASITGLSRGELYALNPGHRGEAVDASSPMRILIPADLSPSIDKKLKTLSGSDYSGGSYWASNNSTPSSPVSAPTTMPSGTVTHSVTTRAPGSSVTTSSNQYTASSTNTVKVAETAPITTSKLATTPKTASALASFAANADTPSAPRIPVAVTQAPNIKPVVTEPPISAKEREQILASVKREEDKAALREAFNPQATAAERQEVVKELTAIAPQGTEVVDPLDGKIKLTAIQTSQSVAEQQGKEVSVGFSYPKGVADNTSPTSVEAKLNSGKVFERQNDDVVVVPPKGKRTTYNVVSGDTLALIATKNGVNWRDVAKWNQIDPESTLYVGTTIYLYDAKPIAAVTREPVATKNEKVTSYVVKPNDSLTGLAEQFGMSIAQLASYNGLSVTSNLFVGQKLTLVDPLRKGVTETNTVKEQQRSVRKESQIKTKTYVVKRGEYLKMIADRYAMSNQELADLNEDLTAGSQLMVGQKIQVPLQEVNTSTKEPVETSRSDAKTVVRNTKLDHIKTENYKVRSGETLSSVAAASGMSLNDLASLNQIPVHKPLLVGQTLKVPAGSQVPEFHTVQAGDSLTAIADKYGIPLSHLANINKLTTSSGVRVGQKLKLTGEPVAETKTAPRTTTHAEDKVVEKVASKTTVSTKNTEKYTVKPGDSLTNLANKSGVSVQALAELNNMNPRANLLRGQMILLPKTTTQYKVKSGDSLIRLAGKYGLETQALADMNGIEANTNLRIGQVITVPN
ncbi:LysM peptidoglycan-binding domain-containing protein [Acinetobacter rudis]|uniref:LysM peptidoglycan-binding domain-containing protein n=1 Tax=Acinetobacter rudis TaxID=632955 RepID=A0AAW8J5F6_9GAMM|nr:LysM peptidoglycan-binding domain-containing protein [Acinetobacter rudis]MDQ8934395.1 LysM peptidoglycan-binding domain-containing protein [Acinetobacter rudis]MDQ9016705.1 LysM peptidoglycan-binding domain-containing protein [Acinetobacter rudis]